MLQRLQNLLSNGFVRAVGILAGGTAAAQLIGIAALPLLTRLYTPDDFAVLAVFAALLGLISGIACLRLEVAIPLPNSDKEAANLLGAALIASACFAVLTLCGSLLFIYSDFQILPVSYPDFFWWLLPVGVWAISSYAALLYWNSRKQRFSVITRTKFIQAFSSVSAQLLLGWTGAIGLLIGQIIMSGFGTLRLFRVAQRLDRTALSAIKPPRAWAALKRYRKFPIYSLPEIFADNAAVQLPVIILASHAFGAEVALIYLSIRILEAPTSLFSYSISQVFLSQISDKIKQGHTSQFTLSILTGLLATAVPMICVLALGVALLGVPIFGQNWAGMPHTILLMVAAYSFKLMSGPISTLMYGLESNFEQLVLMILNLIIRAGCAIYSVLHHPGLIIEFYALAAAIANAMNFFTYAWFAGISMMRTLLLFLGCVLLIGLTLGIASFGFDLI